MRNEMSFNMKWSSDAISMFYSITYQAHEHAAAEIKRRR